MPDRRRPPATPSTRVFVCHAGDDAETTRIVTTHLTRLGLDVWVDDRLEPGSEFSAEIRRRIARAHVFIPLLTERSSTHPWVHQEIGYAVGANVPVFPIAIGIEPTGLIAQLHAAVVSHSLNDLSSRVTREAIDRRADSAERLAGATYERVARALGRSQTLADHANQILAASDGGPAWVRQRTGLSAFAIPDLDTSHQHWDERDGLVPRDAAHRLQLLRERRAMEEHARKAGCSLIIDPTFTLANGFIAKRRRLSTLIEFLESMPNDKVRVAVRRRPPQDPGSLVLVGNWFAATSVSPRPKEGYRETLVTWHGPTVRHHVREFEDELDLLLKEEKLRSRDSRRAAIATLNAILERAARDSVEFALMDRDELVRTHGSLAEWVTKARRDIRISGNDCKIAVCAHAPLLKEAMKRGVNVRVLVVDPTSAAAQMLSKTDPRFSSQEDFVRSMVDVEGELVALQNAGRGSFQYRMLPIVPAFGLVLVDPEDDGLMKAEMHAVKPLGHPETRPHFLVPDEWRPYFLRQWTNLWALGAPPAKPASR